MPIFNVQASIDIATSVNRVQAALADFHTWPMWSPWLYMEPDAIVTYRGTKGELNHGYDWNGNKVGSGGMSLTKCSESRIECDLKFVKPFKSQADVWFDLEVVDKNYTRVTWHMKSSLPFFMFWMTDSMSGMIRSDYNRGLMMLKDYLETDSIPSVSSTGDIVDFNSMSFVGLQGATRMSRVSDSIEASFIELTQTVSKQSIDANGAPLCIYNQVDMKRGDCDYTVALPIVSPATMEQPFVSDTIPDCRALTVIHTGAYRHLGNAWYVLMGEAKHQKLKVSKSVTPFERYLNHPETTDEQNLITELYLPLRS